ncbi:MAG: spondin domain-containing protein [Gammaproteobacteria bacterium]|nr:spondin domain-containing protein [Gammaproteobacteria bacterium]
MDIFKPLALSTLIAAPLFLIGCSSDDNHVSRVSYQIEVTNLTAAQPMSPLAVALHSGSYAMWQIGTSASSGLEQLAEGGDNTALLAEASSAHAVTMTGNGLILPGTSDSIIINTNMKSDLALSFATMLVNTNDGFTGLSGDKLSNLALGETRSTELLALDAGTEANSESVVTIPGPAAGGEGYNVDRDDRDTVGGHPGVVTSADGLATSALGEEHRFDNPVARVTITRLK